MSTNPPLVSVSMICYNAEMYITAAIEGVLNQKVNFPIELVIGDDCSRDKTREICETFEQNYPHIIRLLPVEANLGIGANTARTLGNCRGKYIAICDGDDIWVDPLKLKRQVDFLEKKPEYGVVYTDVETISETGEPLFDPEQEAIRKMYAEGAVFVNLLGANFINNSTSAFRRELISDLHISTDRSYLIPDHIRWLHIAARARVHFMNYKSTFYRKHTSGLSIAVPPDKIRGNRRALRRSYYYAIPIFHQFNTPKPDRLERILLFRRILSLVVRGPGTVGERLKMLWLATKYFPGLTGLINIGLQKAGKLRAINPVILTSEIQELPI